MLNIQYNNTTIIRNMATLRFYPDSGIPISTTRLAYDLLDQFPYDDTIDKFIMKIIRLDDLQTGDMAERILRKLLPMVAKKWKEMESENAGKIKEFSDWFKETNY